tara:strand:+ start:429 stop:788 length:360 start_codon:yes stop_codon:yes gene_type:complete
MRMQLLLVPVVRGLLLMVLLLLGLTLLLVLLLLLLVVELDVVKMVELVEAEALVVVERGVEPQLPALEALVLLVKETLEEVAQDLHTIPAAAVAVLLEVAVTPLVMVIPEMAEVALQIQ